jgi:hypothetical protein
VFDPVSFQSRRSFVSLSRLALGALGLTVAQVHAGTISGRVTRPDGSPVAGIPVVIEQIGGENAPWQTVTGANGAYGVSDVLLFGNIRVSVLAPDHVITPKVADLFFDLSGSANFTIRRGGIALTIVRPNGSPLSDALVTATRAEPGSPETLAGTTDTNGIVILHQVDPLTGSTWQLNTQHPDFTFGESLVFVGAPPTEDRAVRIMAIGFDMRPVLPPANREIPTWVDYNADGKPDLFLAPAQQSTGGSPRLLRFDSTVRPDSGIRLTKPRFAPVANAPFPSARSASTVWRDFDNDGDLDLALLADGLLRLFRQDARGFSLAASLTAPVSIVSGGLAAGDVNQDGLKDLVATGGDPLNAHPQAVVFENLGKLNFKAAQQLTPVGGAVTLADFDLDGDLDVAIGGIASSPSSELLTFLNFNGILAGGGFVTGDFGRFARLTCTDFDSDGLPDLSYVSDRHAGLLRNIGERKFTPFDTIPVNGAPTPETINWGDINNDGRPDFLFGPTCTLAHVRPDGAFVLSTFGNSIDAFAPSFVDIEGSGIHNVAVFSGDPALDTPSYLADTLAVLPNKPPTPPNRISTSSDGEIQRLQWNDGSDDTTLPAALSYNLRVGTRPGAINIVSPEASPTTGQRWIYERGPAEGNVWQLRNLPTGIYYWAVQSIDSGFLGSRWSDEARFFVTTDLTPRIYEALPQADDSIRLTLIAPNARWMIQASTDLTDWTPLGEAIAIQTSVFEFTTPTSPTHRFYRAVRD